jgi:hypothetical protein
MPATFRKKQVAFVSLESFDLASLAGRKSLSLKETSRARAGVVAAEAA